MNLLENLNWRYATKAFDTNKKISQSDLDEILEAFRLSPSGYGLQPWKLILVENPAIRQELLPHSWNQSQVVDASHLLVFARVENPGNELVDAYLDDMVATTGATRENLKGYEDMMKGFFASLSVEAKNAWADRQVFLAAGNVLAFLANKHIDSCPMEGFIPSKYNEILGLSELGLSASMVLPIGYRKEDDKYSSKSKVRFAKKDLVIVK